MIYLTSDLHFCHDREFLFEPRGFSNIEDHDEAIFNNWNAIVKEDDEVFVLGDLMLNNNAKGLDLIKRLNGKIHVILGNHDTTNRVELYKTCDNIVEVVYATIIKYKGKVFYCSHYPTITDSLHKDHDTRKYLYNLYAHTHQQDNFYNDLFFMYHVGLDSHNNCVVSLDQIIEDIANHIPQK